MRQKRGRGLWEGVPLILLGLFIRDNVEMLGQVLAVSSAVPSAVGRLHVAPQHLP